MTTGSFTAYGTDKIVIERAARQRREIKDVSSLAESIRSIGLINPITITRDGVLVAGERRLTAVKSLGWTSVAVQFVDELDTDVLHLIELEENIKRQDISWQEQCTALAKYQDLRKAKDKSWTLERSSEDLGISVANLSKHLRVAEALNNGNAQVKSASTYSTALGLVDRAQARKSASAHVAIVAAAASHMGQDPVPERLPPLINADFAEWAEAYQGERFNLLHCDFPYGVGMDKSDQGAGESHGTYEDSYGVYDALLDVLAKYTPKLVADSAHLIFWFSMDYYSITKTRLELMGWDVSPFPLIWYKADNIGILPDPSRGPRRIYETAFFASRGDRPIVRAVSNLFAAPGRGKSIHMNEKPRAMLKYFLGMVTDEYSRMLDPTSGSGNSCAAAEANGASHVLGIEKDETFFNLAYGAYYDDLLS